MALVLVGLKFPSASQFWGFGLSLHSETQELGESLHRVLLLQSIKSFGTCLPAWCSVQALLGSWLMHPGIGAGAILEQLHHCSCVCCCSHLSQRLFVTWESPWMGPLEILISTGVTTNSSLFGPAHLHWPWHSSQAAPLRDDKSPLQGGLAVQCPLQVFWAHKVRL